MNNRTKNKNKDLEQFKFQQDPQIKMVVANIERMRDLEPLMKLVETELAKNRAMKIEAMVEAGLSRDEAIQIVVADIVKPIAPKTTTNPLAALLGQ